MAGSLLVADCPPVHGEEAGSAAADTLETTQPDKHLGRAALEVVGTNLMVWSFDRFIREGGENPEFRVGSNSIWENMKNRFEWDNNNFGTNNFAHPYHGSLYFTAARANGFDFWQSAPFAFVGSYLWEYTGEINNPAYNDWLNTSLGGVVIGESLFRLSDLVLDDRASGSGRFWREMGGLVISPMRGINRLISGEWSRIDPDAPNRRPEHLGARLETGIRSQSLAEVAEADTSGAFVSFDFLYGDVFGKDEVKPYDEFYFGMQLNFNDVSKLGRVQIHGVLLGATVHESDRTQHFLGAHQTFEYIHNRGFEFGAQSIGALWMSRYGTDESASSFDTEIGLGAALLAGTSSEVANFTGRDYDYGSGFNYRLGAQWVHRGRIVGEFLTEGTWLYTLNGTPGSYFISISHLQATLPVYRNLGVGAEIRGYYRQAWYKDLDAPTDLYPDDFGDVSRWFPEVRGYVSLLAY